MVLLAFCIGSLEVKAGLFGSEIGILKINEIIIDWNLLCFVEIKLLEGKLFFFFLACLCIFPQVPDIIVVFNMNKMYKLDFFCNFSLTVHLVYS